MKKIVNDLIYDTCKATLIDSYYDSGCGILNRYSITKQLFITDHNRFFLYIYKSMFALIFMDHDEDIKPLTNEEAFEYMKNYCPEKIENYFKLKEA